MNVEVEWWRHSPSCPPHARCECGLDHLRALLADALPDTLVAIAPSGEVRVVVPSGTRGRYSLAMPHDPSGVA